MNTFYSIAIVIVISFMLHYLAIRYFNIPKRKNIKRQCVQEVRYEYQPDAQEYMLRQRLELCKQRLQELSDVDVYEKVMYGSIYRADIAGKVNAARSNIEQEMRDINAELMRRKGSK